MFWGLCGVGSSVSELEDVMINEEMRTRPIDTPGPRTL